MIRKQLYIEAEDDRKLKRLAARWKCTEAAVVRKALGNLPEGPRSSDQEMLDRLVALGVIAPPSGKPLTDEEQDEIDRELDEIAAAHPNLPSISQIVIEDRGEL